MAVTKVPFVEGETPPEGYILAQLRNDDGSDGGKFWVDPHTLKSGPVRTEIDAALLPAIKWTWRHLRPRLTWIKTLEDWERGFMHDTNPAGEVQHWMRVTYAYLAFTNEYPKADKASVFGSLVNMMNGAEHTVNPAFVRKKLKRLTDDAPGVLRGFDNFTIEGKLKTDKKHLR